ncbi:NACHT domain-containing protein [Pedobacter sp. AW31-3R]|uniref:NACHT domain-containing protein n=1 Tax=Pedobacter sp. AW31-3R TaxID=3445781 RepID=UPI003FA13535
MEYNDRLNDLRHLILLKSGIKFITPADCKRISIEISRQLNKNVSETTIKRLFGFAVVKHKFSNFTLTTIAEYVDEGSIKQSMLPERESKTSGWQSVKDKVEKITNFTLKTIRNRSGLPYEMTIGRRFAEHDFDDFYQGDYVFTSLISQPGYGKTTLLAHLTEKLFLAPNAQYQTSTVFFVKAYNFFNLEQLNLNLEDQLKSQLEIDSDENTLAYINKHQTKQGGKFIIILDGLAELLLKKEQKNQLFDSIINLICSLEGYKNIRLILSMRSTTWVRFYERIRHSIFLKSAWYAGHYFNLQDLSNVPPLSEKEVELIISKINNLNDRKFNPKLKSQLRFPFHIHLFYQLKEEDPNFNYYSNITFYELVSRYIQEKIYRSNYYTEKILFLKKVIQLTSYGNKTNVVPKNSLIQELSAFKNAYMELLADGILIEEKRYENEHPTEYVRFLHTHMFEYFLFVEILEKFHLQVNASFFEYINTQYDSNHVRFQLLQWTIRFLIKTGNFETLKSIFSLKLNNYEINYLILFIAEEIKYRSKYNPGLALAVDDHNFHDLVIAELSNFDFIDSCYREAIGTLIDIANKDEHLSIYNALLGIIDVLSIDKAEVKKRIDNLNTLNIGEWTANPLDALHIIHKRLNATSVGYNRLLMQIDAFKSGENPFGINANVPMDTKQGISFILILFANFFTSDYEGNITIIEAFAEFRPDLFCKNNTFVVFLLSIYGISESKRSPSKRAPQIEQLYNDISDLNNPNFTKYQEAILMMHQTKELLHLRKFEQAAEHAKECLELFKRNEMIFDAIACYNLLINIAEIINDQHMVNEYRYEKILLLDERQISGSLF